MFHFVHFRLGDSATLFTQVNILSHVRVSTVGSGERKKPVYCFCAHTTVYVCAGGGGDFSVLPYRHTQVQTGTCMREWTMQVKFGKLVAICTTPVTLRDFTHTHT